MTWNHIILCSILALIVMVQAKRLEDATCNLNTLRIALTNQANKVEFIPYQIESSMTNHIVVNYGKMLIVTNLGQIIMPNGSVIQP